MACATASRKLGIRSCMAYTSATTIYISCSYALVDGHAGFDGPFSPLSRRERESVPRCGKRQVWLRLLLLRARPQHHQSAALQRVLLPTGALYRLALGVGGIEQAFPRLPLAGRREREGNGLVMGIQQQQDGIAHNGLAMLIHIAYEITRHPYSQAAHIPGIPGLFSHLLT